MGTVPGDDRRRAACDPAERLSADGPQRQINSVDGAGKSNSRHYRHVSTQGMVQREASIVQGAYDLVGRRPVVWPCNVAVIIGSGGEVPVELHVA
jgi:hypothetical protein